MSLWIFNFSLALSQIADADETNDINKPRRKVIPPHFIPAITVIEKISDTEKDSFTVSRKPPMKPPIIKTKREITELKTIELLNAEAGSNFLLLSRCSILYSRFVIAILWC